MKIVLVNSFNILRHGLFPTLFFSNPRNCLRVIGKIFLPLSRNASAGRAFNPG
jgi:hypothetical protein